MSERAYPFELKPVQGCWTEEHVGNSIASLGVEASAGRALAGLGWVPADVMFAQTLLLLDGQRRATATAGVAERSGGENAVAGGVWVREQITVHRPVRIGATFWVEGQIARSYSIAGRLYSVSTSESRNADGALLVSSCTTGLAKYRKDPSLADSERGVSDAELLRTGPDASMAHPNPAFEKLRSARVGDRFDGSVTEVTLEMMRARDGGRSRNPIHTEPEEARRAGLFAPIAGGSHVFAFAQELLLVEWGPDALIHGAHFDVRWRAPVHAGESVSPHASVTRANDTHVEVELRVECRAVDAMVGHVVVPLRGADP